MLTQEQVERIIRSYEKQKEYHRRYYQEHKERIREYHRAYSARRRALVQELKSRGLL